jgi:carbonic anhydrase
MEPPPPGAEPSPNLTGSMHLPLLLGSIRAGLGLVRSDASADPWGDAVRVNVRRTISQISLWSMPIRGRVEAGRLAIVGAVYDVQTGEVKFLNR